MKATRAQATAPLVQAAELDYYAPVALSSPAHSPDGFGSNGEAQASAPKEDEARKETASHPLAVPRASTLGSPKRSPFGTDGWLPWQHNVLHPLLQRCQSCTPGWIPC